MGMTGMAHASNIVVDGSFEGTTITQISAYNGAVGQWLADSNWIIASGDLNHQSSYAQADFLAPKETDPRRLYQVVHYAGANGTISLAHDMAINPYLGVALYGSHTKPSDGATWNSPWANCAFGDSIFDTTASGALYDWVPSVWGDGKFANRLGYEWYTVVIRGEISKYDGYSSKTDNLSIDVPAAVPIPGAVWLLGSGLAGLGLFRRRKTSRA
jgi:hypothetical protein